MSNEKRQLWSLLTAILAAMQKARDMGRTYEAEALERLAERVREDMEAA